MRCEEFLEHVWVAIIAGGQGTRLFPLSHPERPKQFCQLTEKDTFIQSVIKNFTWFDIPATRFVVVTTNQCQTDLAIEQTLPRGILSQNILQISPLYGYAGAMVKAAEFIYNLDPDAIIINTPSDQYLKLDDSFATAIDNAIVAAKKGRAVVVGVKVNDLVVATGLGHAVFDPKDKSPCPAIMNFVEKPDKKEANRLMRAGNSAANTGINVWAAQTVLEATAALDTSHGLATDVLMSHLGSRLDLSSGNFVWHDCGTLQSFYKILPKTPNHKNATLGIHVERYDCRNSLFVCAEEGYILCATGFRDVSLVVATIEDRTVAVAASLAESQKVKQLAERYDEHREYLIEDFSFNARNNIVMRGNVENAFAGFVGVENVIIHFYKQPDGRIRIHASQQ